MRKALVSLLLLTGLAHGYTEVLGVGDTTGSTALPKRNTTTTFTDGGVTGQAPYVIALGSKTGTTMILGSTAVVTGTAFNGSAGTSPVVTIFNTISQGDITGAGKAVNLSVTNGGTTNVPGNVMVWLNGGIGTVAATPLFATFSITGAATGASSVWPLWVSATNTGQGATNIWGTVTANQGTAAAASAAWPTAPTVMMFGTTTLSQVTGVPIGVSPAPSGTALLVYFNPSATPTVSGVYPRGTSLGTTDPVGVFGMIAEVGGSVALVPPAGWNINTLNAPQSVLNTSSSLATAGPPMLRVNYGTQYAAQSGTTQFQTAGSPASQMTSTGSGGVAADIRSVGAAGPGTTTVFTIVTGASGGNTLTIDASMAGGNEIDVALEPASGSATDEIKFSFDTPYRTSSCADAALNGWPVTHKVYDQAVLANAALIGPAKKSNLNLKVGDKIYFVNVTGTQPVHVWVSQTR